MEIRLVLRVRLVEPAGTLPADEVLTVADLLEAREEGAHREGQIERPYERGHDPPRPLRQPEREKARRGEARRGADLHGAVLRVVDPQEHGVRHEGDGERVDDETEEGQESQRDPDPGGAPDLDRPRSRGRRGVLV